MAEKKVEATAHIRQELEQLTVSIAKMMEIFRLIRRPIQESFETVPTTAHHLENVSEQTEQAANKVLDMVEAINNRESQINEWITRAREIIPADILADSVELSELLDNIAGNAESNLNDSFSIMEAMQFQDITAQQMDHAITLLDGVEDRLTSLLSTVGMKPLKPRPKRKNKKRVFDPNAKFTLDDSKKQQEIDEIISSIE